MKINENQCKINFFRIHSVLNVDFDESYAFLLSFWMILLRFWSIFNNFGGFSMDLGWASHENGGFSEKIEKKMRKNRKKISKKIFVKKNLCHFLIPGENWSENFFSCLDFDSDFSTCFGPKNNLAISARGWRGWKMSKKWEKNRKIFLNFFSEKNYVIFWFPVKFWVTFFFLAGILTVILPVLAQKILSIFSEVLDLDGKSMKINEKSMKINKNQ